MIPPPRLASEAPLDPVSFEEGKREKKGKERSKENDVSRKVSNI